MCVCRGMGSVKGHDPNRWASPHTHWFYTVNSDQLAGAGVIVPALPFVVFAVECLVSPPSNVFLFPLAAFAAAFTDLFCLHSGV